MVESRWLKHVVQVLSFTGSNHTKWFRVKMLAILTFLFAENSLNSSLVKKIWNQIWQWSWTYTMKVKLLVLTTNWMLGQQRSIYLWSWVGKFSHTLFGLNPPLHVYILANVAALSVSESKGLQKAAGRSTFRLTFLLLRQRTYKRVTLKREAHNKVSSGLSLLWRQNHAI